jgi:hypothetical protein
MKVLRLVALARLTRPHKILDDLLHMRKMKITSKPVHGALDTLVPLPVDGRQQAPGATPRLGARRGGRRSGSCRR